MRVRDSPVTNGTNKRIFFRVIWFINEMNKLTREKIRSFCEVHYIEKNTGMFSSETLISFRLKKERHGHRCG